MSFRFVLELSNDPMRNVVAIISHICNVNGPISYKLKMPALVRACQRFQLAIKEIFLKEEL